MHTVQILTQKNIQDKSSLVSTKTKMAKRNQPVAHALKLGCSSFKKEHSKTKQKDGNCSPLSIDNLSGNRPYLSPMVLIGISVSL